jgi:hypothetical protein
MTEETETAQAVSALREAAAELHARADQLEALAEENSRREELKPVEQAPLAPAESESEAAARLIALEGATTGRPRAEVIAEIERDFPGVDAHDLTGRFYS